MRAATEGCALNSFFLLLQRSLDQPPKCDSQPTGPTNGSRASQHAKRITNTCRHLGALSLSLSLPLQARKENRRLRRAASLVLTEVGGLPVLWLTRWTTPRASPFPEQQICILGRSFS